jgi:hypothetical protein
MTVKELIEQLQKEDPDRLVVLSSDSEGNSYSELYSLRTGAYSKGEVGLETLTEEDEEAGYGEEDVLNGEPAIILHPG